METSQGNTGWQGTLDRLLGAGMIVAAVAMAAAILFHPEESPAGMTSGLWGPLHAVFFIALFVILFGIFRLYALAAEGSRGTGLAALVLLILGMVGFAGAMVLEAAVMPVLAGSDATLNLLEDSGPLFSGPLGIWMISFAVSFAVGAILFGLILKHAAGMPRWAGYLFFSAPLFTFEPPLPLWVGKVGLVIFSIGIAGLGWGLWKKGSGEQER